MTAFKAMRMHLPERSLLAAVQWNARKIEACRIAAGFPAHRRCCRYGSTARRSLGDHEAMRFRCVKNTSKCFWKSSRSGRSARRCCSARQRQASPRTIRRACNLRPWMRPESPNGLPLFARPCPPWPNPRARRRRREKTASLPGEIDGGTGVGDRVDVGVGPGTTGATAPRADGTIGGVTGERQPTQKGAWTHAQDRAAGHPGYPVL